VPVPPRIAITQIRLCDKLSIRNIRKPARNLNADIHRLHFIPPLILVGPPDAGSGAFARGVDPRVACWIGLEGEGPKPADLGRVAGVVKVNGVCLAGPKRLRKIDEHRAVVTGVLQCGRAEKDFVDIELIGQVDLNARGILNHAETNRVAPADELLCGIDPNRKVVVEKIVVGAERTVSPAKHVQSRGNGRSGVRWRRRTPWNGSLLLSLAGQPSHGCKAEKEEAQDRHKLSKVHGLWYRAAQCS